MVLHAYSQHVLKYDDSSVLRHLRPRRDQVHDQLNLARYYGCDVGLPRQTFEAEK